MNRDPYHVHLACNSDFDFDSSFEDSSLSDFVYRRRAGNWGRKSSRRRPAVPHHSGLDCSCPDDGRIYRPCRPKTGGQTREVWGVASQHCSCLDRNVHDASREPSYRRRDGSDVGDRLEDLACHHVQHQGYDCSCRLKPSENWQTIHRWLPCRRILLQGPAAGQPFARGTFFGLVHGSPRSAGSRQGELEVAQWRNKGVSTRRRQLVVCASRA